MIVWLCFVCLSFAGSLAGGFFFPWWWPALVGVLLSLWKPKTRLSHPWANFLGTALAWGLLATYFNFGNHNLLADRVANLFHLSNGWWMVAITSALGGGTAALGAWAAQPIVMRFDAK